MALTEGQIVANLNLGQNADKLLSNQPSDPIVEVTGLFIQELIEDLKQTLDDEGISANGSLKASIVPSEIKLSSNGISVSITADDYGNYIEEGVKGVENQSIDSPFSFKTIGVSKDHAEAVAKWIPARGIQPRENQTIKSLSYALATSIKKKGIKPQPWQSKVFTDETMNAFKLALTEVMGISIASQFKQFGE